MRLGKRRSALAPVRAMRLGWLLLVAGLFFGCPQPPNNDDTVNRIAETFVKLALALGQHDEDYVDAYLGPDEWRLEAERDPLPPAEIRRRGQEALEDLTAARLSDGEEGLQARRLRSLKRSLEALVARVDLVSGKKLGFDEESQALYDATAPHYSEDHFQSLASDIDALLPGEGPLSKRYEEFKQDFVIPNDRLDDVFRAAIDACRERTLRYLPLPDEESLEIEYVTDKSWSGYNWYQGDYHSLIQLNTDLPSYIDKAIDLACHEGYPGHHVFNVLIERDLVRGRGWVEFSIYPLFSPRSLIAEGTANFGIEMAFPGDDRLEYERETLFPLAGLDPERADHYYRVQALVDKLSYAGNEAARGYLDGAIDRDEAAAWLTRYALMPEARAQKRVRFIDQYRSYVINYNLGQDLVREFVESGGGSVDDPKRRWQAFADLLSSPVLPSDLAR